MLQYAIVILAPLAFTDSSPESRVNSVGCASQQRLPIQDLASHLPIGRRYAANSQICADRQTVIDRTH